MSTIITIARVAQWESGCPTSNMSQVQSLSLVLCDSGGMVDTLVLETSALTRRVGSNPIYRIFIIGVTIVSEPTTEFLTYCATLLDKRSKPDFSNIIVDENVRVISWVSIKIHLPELYEILKPRVDRIQDFKILVNETHFSTELLIQGCARAQKHERRKFFIDDPELAPYVDLLCPEGKDDTLILYWW